MVVVQGRASFFSAHTLAFLWEVIADAMAPKRAKAKANPNLMSAVTVESEAKRARLEAEDSDDAESVDLERQLAV